MQDMFKGNVSMQDTHTQIMSSCKTLQFRKTCLLSLVGRHDLLKDMSSCLKMHFYCFYFLCFILLKACLFPRHVLNMAPRHDFYSVSIRPGWAHSQRRVGVNITIPLHWPSCEWTLTLPIFLVCVRYQQ